MALTKVSQPMSSTPSIDTIEAGLQAQIDALENPVSANGLPW